MSNQKVAVNFRVRRISPQKLESQGWTCTYKGLGPHAVWLHRLGWTLEHCGHPTANYPWLLTDPDGQRILTGAVNGMPMCGRAWPTLAAAAQYVQGFIIAAGAHQADVLSARWREPLGNISTKAGRIERDSPLFFGSGENPTLF